MRIAVCSPQVPFVHGGAEIFAGDLVAELNRRDHEAALVTVPFKWYPGARVLTQALLWRLLDLGEAGGRQIDLVIATKFPSYVVRHPNKIVWLLHQFRQAYELDRTELGQFGEAAADRAVRRSVQELDRVTLGEARRVFVTSRNVADRLDRSLGIAAEVLPHPPQDLAYRCEAYDGFILSVGRLDRAKRVDLLLEALALGQDLRAVVAGDGPDRDRLEELARGKRLDGRIEFVGRVESAALADLYARCCAVYYAPAGGDSGLVPYEAFLAEKPVVTTTDAGGPLEIVTDRATGIVCEPEALSLAEAFTWLLGHPDDARAWGRAGKEIANTASWDRAIERLLGAGAAAAHRE
jgi:glycosyltransferase involved in cell wall biosynthesis